MGQLVTEYTDIKEVKHRVEHQTISVGDKMQRERMVEELTYALTKSDKKFLT